MSYDVVLLGATGYTGQLVAKQLRERFPTLSWAVAGRNLEKLNKLVLDLGTTGRSSYPAVELVSLDDEDAVRALVKRTKVVINTAGPFSEHGEVVLKACATGGKHYVDCAGEMPWLKEMIEKYDTTAKENGAIIVSACGVGSVPADLLTLAMVDENRREFHTPTSQVVVSIHDIKCRVTGGSVRSAVHSIATYGMKKCLEAFAPFALSPVRPVRGSDGLTDLSASYLKRLGFGTVGLSLQGDNDRAVVHRSWGLMKQAADESDIMYSYGPRFTFKSVARFAGAIKKATFTAWYYSTVMLLSMLPVTRRVALHRYPAGSGPTPEERRNNFFEYRGVAVADFKDKTVAQPGERPPAGLTRGTLRFDGDMYEFTALALAEAADVLLDDADGTLAGKLRGVVTPAMLGDPFKARLLSAGLDMTLTAEM